MTTNLLVRGLLIGLLAGILAFGYARVFGEPQVERAIAFEQQIERARSELPAPELVSRETQSGLGLFTGMVVYGAAIGGLFALVFAGAYGRVGGLSPRAAAALLALAGFLTIVVVPGLKYPANPPSVGDPATIGQRTALYFVMVAISLAACVLAVGLARRLTRRLGAWNAALAAGAAFIVAIAIVQHALPDIDEVPERLSAVVLWRFRIAALGIQAVMWTTLGLAFGVAAERSLARHPTRRRATGLALR